MSFTSYAKLIFDASLASLGEPVVYSPKKGEKQSLMGIFTQAYQLVAEGSFESEVSSSVSVVEISNADLNLKPKPGDQLLIRGETYRVAEVMPDFEGQTKLALKRVGL